MEDGSYFRVGLPPGATVNLEASSVNRCNRCAAGGRLLFNMGFLLEGSAKCMTMGASLCYMYASGAVLLSERKIRRTALN
eukprot:3428030-Pyramimonas_sp.AAC.1